MKRKVLIRLVLCLLVFCCACGLRTPHAPKATVYLSPSDAERITGVPMKLVYDVENDAQSSCAFEAQEEMPPCGVLLSFAYLQPEHVASWDAYADIDDSKFGRVEQLTGLGDLGWVTTRDDGHLTVYVRNKLLTVQLHADSPRPLDETRKELIETAHGILAALASEGGMLSTQAAELAVAPDASQPRSFGSSGGLAPRR